MGGHHRTPSLCYRPTVINGEKAAFSLPVFAEKRERTLDLLIKGVEQKFRVSLLGERRAVGGDRRRKKEQVQPWPAVWGDESVWSVWSRAVHCSSLPFSAPLWGLSACDVCTCMYLTSIHFSSVLFASCSARVSARPLFQQSPP